MLEERKIFLNDESFRPKFGYTDNVFRESVKVKEDLLKNNPEKLHAGVFLSKDASTKKWGLAQPGDFPVCPIIDFELQFDNTMEAFGGITVARGSVPYYTKHFTGTPQAKDKLKTVDGKLEVLAGEDPEDYVVARVEDTNGTTLQIITEN